MADTYDIIVIGGGISGLGIVREAARRGYTAVLVEKGRCCKATSDNSMRIIHGGLRYLQTLDLPRTLHSLKAQADLLAQAPALVKPLACLMPLKRFGLKSRWPVTGALAFYNLLARVIAPGAGSKAKVVAASFVDQSVPVLKGLAPHGALLWQDAILPDPPHFAAWVIKEAQTDGARIMEHTEAIRLSRAGPSQLELECLSGEGRLQLRAAVVVNAAGPWLRTLNVEAPLKVQREPGGWCKAFNIILRKQLESKYAFGLAGSEGRLYFTVPRGNGTVIGTFHEIYRDHPDRMSVSGQEIEGALREYRQALPAVKIGPEDVEGVEAGVLPMRRVSAGLPVLYGSEQIYGGPGYFEVLSTKYTTFQHQARSVMARVRPRRAEEADRRA
jgi:glycerol-3-phosphate dehydrogenase